jgi:hypothetical protein
VSLLRPSVMGTSWWWIYFGDDETMHIALLTMVKLKLRPFQVRLLPYHVSL